MSLTGSERKGVSLAEWCARTFRNSDRLVVALENALEGRSNALEVCAIAKRRNRRARDL